MGIEFNVIHIVASVTYVDIGRRLQPIIGSIRRDSLPDWIGAGRGQGIAVIVDCLRRIFGDAKVIAQISDYFLSDVGFECPHILFLLHPRDGLVPFFGWHAVLDDEFVCVICGAILNNFCSPDILWKGYELFRGGGVLDWVALLCASGD